MVLGFPSFAREFGLECNFTVNDGANGMPTSALLLHEATFSCNKDNFEDVELSYKSQESSAS